MSNVYKANFIQFSPENTKVIDSNSLVAKRLEGFSGVLREIDPDIDVPGGYTDEDGNSVDPVAMAELLADRDNPDEQEDPEPEVPEETAEDIEKMKQDALDEIEQVKAIAREEIENLRADAKKEGYEEGYNEGKEQAEAEYAEKMAALKEQEENLNRDYNELVKELEPKMVDVITGVYTKVFGDNFFNQRDVMVALISKALSSLGINEEIIIHVSDKDYNMLLGVKQQIFEWTNFTKEPEIRPEESLKPGEARVETPYGIMDCGIDTELKELSRVLHVLSYEDR